jgi:hypothetical protein
MKPGYFVIPIDICIWAVKNMAYSKLQLYLYLKTNSPKGFCIIDNNLVIKYCELVNISKSSFYNHMNFLIKSKLIYKISDNGVIVQAFIKLFKFIPFTTNKGVVFEEVLPSDFKGFIIAAIITYYGSLKKKAERKKELKRGNCIIGKKRTNYRSTIPFFTLEHTYLAKCLNISKASAQKLRIHACKSGFITSKHCFIRIEIDKAQLNNYRKYSAINPFSLILIKGKVFQQESDKLTSSITLRKLFKIKYHFYSKNRYQLKKGYKGN